jgi:EF hand domain-containing protein
MILGGCMGKPARIDAPDWEPEQSADQAIASLDADGDGMLSMEELDAAPGLKYCAKGLDAEGDKDGKLSRDEIYARIELYQKSRTGLKAFSCNVTLDGKPLSGATVRLVPEPFMGDAVEPNEGVSDKGGQARFQDEKINMSLAKIGMYKVEITSPDVTIPTMYNSATTLGVEILPVTDPYHQGPVVFHLKSRK